MKHIIALSLILLLSFNTFAQQTEKTLTYFDYESYELSTQSKLAIDMLLVNVEDKNIISIDINAHTDSDGDAIYNQLLSQNRANEVKQYIISQGIEVTEISVNSCGESQPLTTNSTDLGKQENRRVEIIVNYIDIIGEVEQVILPKPLDEVMPVNNNLQHFFEDNIQTFKIPANIECQIEGEKGSVIYFNKNSFVDAKGEIAKGDINIELIEAYSNSDMIINNLNTMSNGSILESNGMINISVSSDGEKLQLAENKSIGINFASEYDEGMEIFYGDTTGGNINWEAASGNSLSDDDDINYINNPIYGNGISRDTVLDGIVISTSSTPIFEGRSISSNEVDIYIYQSDKLGWINCDKFTRYKKITKLTVIHDIDDEVRCFLYFKSYKSILQPDFNDNEEFIFSGVPVGKSVIIISYKVEGDDVLYSKYPLTIKKNQNIIIDFKRTTKEEFFKIIDNL